jgi:hypothetical protein
MDIPHSLFDEKLEKKKHSKGVEHDTDLTADDLKDLVEQYKNVYVEAKGEKFPSGTKFKPFHVLLLCMNIHIVIHPHTCFHILS